MTSRLDTKTAIAFIAIDLFNAHYRIDMHHNEILEDHPEALEYIEKAIIALGLELELKEYKETSYIPDNLTAYLK